MLDNEGSLNDSDFEFLRQRVSELSGIHLTVQKKVLLESRLTTRILELGIPSIHEYAEYLRTLPSADDEWQELVNCITTNKTEFFRESGHFQYLLQEFLPTWQKRNRCQKIRVWCAACSTGEEPYTLAMVLDRFFNGEDRFEIVASDIDTEVLEHAANAVYPVSRLREIPKEYQPRAAQVGSEDMKDWFRIKSAIRSKIRFEQRNLIEFPYTNIGTYDVIFCRNVFIYFKPELIERIVEAMSSVCAPDGLLAIGYSESIQAGRNWKPSGPSLFRKPTPASKKVIEMLKPGVAPVVALTPAAPKRPHKVLIVDDSPTIQQLLKKILSRSPDLEVVGTIGNPLQVEEAVVRLRPDVLTMDIHMPEMTGCDLLAKLLPKYPIPTVMITSLSMEESDHVFRALELGAVDYLQKPVLSELEQMAPIIVEKVVTAASVKIRQGQAPARGSSKRDSIKHSSTTSLVAIGSSTGGTEALKVVLTELPENIPPIVIVQHIPPVFSAAFARRLDQLCAFEVKEAEDGDELLQSRVLIAPGGRHMELVKTSSGGFAVRLKDTAPVNRHRPSVDVLFDSVAKHAGKKAIGIILTGMGADGAKGLLAMKQTGARTIAQDEQSCTVFGMPKEAIKLGAADQICALDRIAGTLVEWLEEKSNDVQLRYKSASR